MIDDYLGLLLASLDFVWITAWVEGFGCIPRKSEYSPIRILVPHLLEVHAP